MRKFLLILVLFCFLTPSIYAKHIKGGWIQYEYVGAGTTAGTSIYKITVYVFRSCTDPGPMPSSLGIYDAVTYSNIQTITTASYSLVSNDTKTTFDPCLSNPPVICYQTFTYSTNVTLPNSTNGYMIVAQDANRIANIKNISNSVSTGISFIGNIPGIINTVDYHQNSSPFFAFKDTAIICYNTKFTYQFTATDADSDSLSYSFGNGFNGSSVLTSPPYSTLAYVSGYSGTSPLGGSVTIDPTTGLISGTAPSVTGDYVIAVYVDEWRNGVKINSTRKELQINVANCSLAAAALQNVYLNCKDFSFTFQNESAASNITSYLWDFGVTTSTKDTSTTATPSFTYADTGTYVLKLQVGTAAGCKDSTKATVKVYPGFKPSFTAIGNCYQTPVLFSDNSLVKYGSVTSRFFDFGDIATTTDTSSLLNPTYKYPAPGSYTVLFSLSSSVCCSDTTSKSITINDKPFLFLPFTDTLICSIDSLPLKAQATGTFVWSPSNKMLKANTLSPIVFPKDTTVYTITVTDQGCIDIAKIKVNVLKFITVKLGLDTGICKTDSILLKPVSDALSYKWRESTNAGSMNSYTAKYPIVAPLVNTTYYVTANLGYCQDSTKVKVNVSPYPTAQLGPDTVICFGSRLSLSAVFQGSSFSWTPTSSLINQNTIRPTAGPVKTTSYIFNAKDTMYCPKTVSDTIVVKVIQPFNVNAGNDTSVAIGQTLQLTVTGGESGYTYKWTPNTYLNNNLINNPELTVNTTGVDSIRYFVAVSSPEGCLATDNVLVKIYNGGPEIYVPSAFTPNGDGRNDVLKPFLVGITKLNYFSVFNRWGIVVFTTTEMNKGWDGNFQGVPQGSGAFVYAVQGVDNTGKTILRKGTVVLIR